MKHENTASDWMDATKAAPPRNNEFEVLHFGDLAEKYWLIQKGKWGAFGFYGVENEAGEHCKVSTITHWRISNAKADRIEVRDSVKGLVEDLIYVASACGAETSHLTGGPDYRYVIDAGRDLLNANMGGSSHGEDSPDMMVENDGGVS